jgi:two-component system, OmpR family, sensor histidine kinase MtrB
MSGVPSSGPGGEAQARVNDLAPGSRRASSGALAPQWLAPGLTAFRGVLSVDGGGPLAGAVDALRRRLPLPIRRMLRSVRRWARAVIGRFRRRWHRSLQLRVVATTLVISAVMVAVLGFFLVQQIAGGLLANERTSALTQTSDGLAIAQGRPDMLGPHGGGPAALNSLAADLQAGSGPGDLYDVVILQQHASPGLAGVVGNQALAPSIPRALIAAVTAEQRKGHSDRLQSTPTRLVYANGRPGPPALAVGVPISSHDQLYYLFPLTPEQQALSLVETTLIGAVVLLAVIVSLVTRWVVVPLRQAAQAASRLSAGNLDERMPARGTDDLAALSNSFNDMAASLQDKLRELEELSKAQRQFVSDVSHELRTPLTTIRIAADVLFEAKGHLDPAAGRSAELLQGQLERFEALLADLLEISRHDANVATLDAESADVCDLVRRAAADAEQLAARKGTRIDFRLPPEPCVAEVDRRRVERILRNLLDNAVEHGEGRDVVVTVATDRDAAAVAVRDHGVGFGPGEQYLVFDRFWRADPARARTTGGTGLGLAIALEDARLHGGWLQAWGEPGKGSVFRLTLPRALGQELAGSPLPLGPDEAEVAAVGEHLILGGVPGADDGPPATLAEGDVRLASGEVQLASSEVQLGSGEVRLASGSGNPAGDGNLVNGDGGPANGDASLAGDGEPAGSDGRLASGNGHAPSARRGGDG